MVCVGARRWFGLGVLLSLGCSSSVGGSADSGVLPGDGATAQDNGAGTDSAVSPGDGAVTDGAAPTDGGPMACTDSDNDGISDYIEGRYNHPPTDTDGDGMPDYLDADSDNDAISDLDEGVRRYAGFPSEALPALTCGQSPAHCSPSSSLGNWRNLDSDADGLSDHDEVFTYHTDPCNPNTHNDNAGNPVPDLVWAAAGGMAPPPSSLYVTLPYADPACGVAGGHLHKQFDFTTRFHSADIFFLVDTTGSMGGTISTLQTTLTTTIIPSIEAAVGTGADLRFGAADYRSHPEGPDGSPGSDYIVHVGQRLTRNVPAVQAFINGLTAGGGGDYAEPLTEAAYQVLTGEGLPDIPGHLDDLTVQHGCNVMGFGSTCTAPNLGWASPIEYARDCGVGPDDPPVYGYGCFEPQRVPIVVMFSDANWVHDLHDHCDGSAGSGTPCATIMGFGTSGHPTYALHSHTFAELSTQMVSHGVYFVGVDVGVGDTHINAMQLATNTGTLDGTGSPIAPMGTPTAVATNVIDSVTTLATATRQDVTRQILAVSSSGIAAGHSSADFLRAVTPVRGDPPAPMGYDHADATTFYNVAPSTVVTFDADFFNDFQRPTNTLQLFQATIVVIGRAGTELSRHQVYIVVPSNSCVIPG